MENTNFIGIDVSKASIHIYQLEIKKYQTIKNNYKDLQNYFKEFDTSAFIVYEPT